MTDVPQIDLALPYITGDLPGVGGVIKAEPEHFVVDEIPLYEPSGSGEHLYVNVTKTGMTTREVQVGLAELFQLKPENVGKAGLKAVSHGAVSEGVRLVFTLPTGGHATILLREFMKTG